MDFRSVITYKNRLIIGNPCDKCDLTTCLHNSKSLVDTGMLEDSYEQFAYLIEHEAKHTRPIIVYIPVYDKRFEDFIEDFQVNFEKKNMILIHRLSCMCIIQNDFAKSFNYLYYLDKTKDNNEKMENYRHNMSLLFKLFTKNNMKLLVKQCYSHELLKSRILTDCDINEIFQILKWFCWKKKVTHREVKKKELDWVLDAAQVSLTSSEKSSTTKKFSFTKYEQKIYNSSVVK